MIEDNGDPLNPASAAYRPECPEGAELIAEERARQVAKGFATASDDKQTDGQLLRCASFVISDVMELRGDEPVSGWPQVRAEHIHEKYGKDYIRRLTIAGALIAAEIDRLIRLERAKEASQGHLS